MRKFLFLALAACMLQISASAFSDGAGLTLDAGVSGVTVKVYDVGSVRDGAYVLDDAFSRYGTDLNVDGAADELAGSFRKDGMACLRYGVTDEYGRVEFGGLGPGVYLASCDGFESGGAAFGSYAVLLESDGAADMTVARGCPMCRRPDCPGPASRSRISRFRRLWRLSPWIITSPRRDVQRSF